MLAATGRVVTGLFFVLAGVNKLTQYGETLSLMDGAGLPTPQLLLPVVIALEIGGGATVMAGRGRKAVLAAALALAAFTVATNLAFHRFWELDGMMHRLELSLFFKNLVVAAALLMVAGATRPTPRSG